MVIIGEHYASQEQAEHNPIFPLGGITTQKKVFAIFPFMVKTWWGTASFLMVLHILH